MEAYERHSDFAMILAILMNAASVVMIIGTTIMA
jgi:hypothetical protein